MVQDSAPIEECRPAKPVGATFQALVRIAIGMDLSRGTEATLIQRCFAGTILAPQPNARPEQMPMHSYHDGQRQERTPHSCCIREQRAFGHGK
ncbi:hypothetical protein BST61_g9406 [Cercospora zeina]